MPVEEALPTATPGGAADQPQGLLVEGTNFLAATPGGMADQLQEFLVQGAHVQSPTGGHA